MLTFYPYKVFQAESECYFFRASIASKKDRLESASRQLETNRAHMAREAKKAAKLEKKLRTLTAGQSQNLHKKTNRICVRTNCLFILGYQSRSQVLSKQLHDMTEQIEAARCELDTYTFLKKHEDGKNYFVSIMVSSIVL